MKEEKTKDVNDLNKVPCPFCGHENELWENSDLTTYWGEEGEKEQDCHSCDKTFLILEHVSRYWEIAKTSEDYD